MLSIFEEFVKKNLKFTIQEHKAEKAGIHYDLRLEYEGKLKSWASRKIPDLVDGKTKKIMLFQTEDHDMKWHKFKGTIESGYGKGEVDVWDSGTYNLVKWDINESIIVDFKGKKIKGQYVIIPYSPKKNQDQESFLMFKKK